MRLRADGLQLAERGPMSAAPLVGYSSSGSEDEAEADAAPPASPGAGGRRW